MRPLHETTFPFHWLARHFNVPYRQVLMISDMIAAGMISLTFMDKDYPAGIFRAVKQAMTRETMRREYDR